MEDWLGSIERVLVVCAHTDDELGCAGLIIRLRDTDVPVRYLALSRCEESVPPQFAKDVLEQECLECTYLLGIPRNMVDVKRYRVRYFPSYRQEILEELVAINRSYEPSLVLLPSSFDTHQDHAVVSAEGFRAFKQSSILGYELPQNLISFNNTAFVELEEKVMDRKLAALAKYQSQAFRSYTSSEFIRGLARVRGGQINNRYAEAYEVVRLIL